MKFLVDAQLPARLARFLNDAGHDTLHTSELPDGNRTTDVQIAAVADGEGRVVVTEDRDFREGICSRGRRAGCWSWRRATSQTRLCWHCSR